MDFALSFTGAPGSISATLTQGGTTIATTSGLKDGAAARKWAKKVSRDHKVENTPEATETESVSIYGSSTFSL